MEFSKKVKYGRMKRPLTRDAAAKETGIGGAMITRWEHGECKPQLALLAACGHAGKEAPE